MYLWWTHTIISASHLPRACLNLEWHHLHIFFSGQWEVIEVAIDLSFIPIHWPECLNCTMSSFHHFLLFWPGKFRFTWLAASIIFIVWFSLGFCLREQRQFAGYILFLRFHIKMEPGNRALNMLVVHVLPGAFGLGSIWNPGRTLSWMNCSILNDLQRHW